MSKKLVAFLKLRKIHLAFAPENDIVVKKLKR